jgi:hypothetical protein
MFHKTLIPATLFKMDLKNRERWFVHLCPAAIDRCAGGSLKNRITFLFQIKQFKRFQTILCCFKRPQYQSPVPPSSARDRVRGGGEQRGHDGEDHRGREREKERERERERDKKETARDRQKKDGESNRHPLLLLLIPFFLLPSCLKWRKEKMEISTSGHAFWRNTGLIS